MENNFLQEEEDRLCREYNCKDIDEVLAVQDEILRGKKENKL